MKYSELNHDMEVLELKLDKRIKLGSPEMLIELRKELEEFESILNHLYSYECIKKKERDMYVNKIYDMKERIYQELKDYLPF